MSQEKEKGEPSWVLYICQKPNCLSSSGAQNFQIVPYFVGEIIFETVQCETCKQPMQKMTGPISGGRSE